MMSIPTADEVKLLDAFSSTYHCTPNLVIDIFKNRRGRWNNIRLWCLNDLGSCRRVDLFVTTKKLESVKEFQIIDFTSDSNGEYTDLLNLYNTGEINDDAAIEFIINEMEKPQEKETVKEIFNMKERLNNRDFEDFL